MRTQFLRCEVVDIDERQYLAIEVAHCRGLGFGDDAGGLCLRNLPGDVECCDLAGLDAVDSDAFFNRLRDLCHDQRFVQQTERVVRLHGTVHGIAETIAHLGGIEHQVRDLAAEAIARRRIMQSARENAETQHTGDKCIGKISQEAVQLFLSLVEQTAACPLNDRQILGLAALIFVVLEHHRCEVHA